MVNYMNIIISSSPRGSEGWIKLLNWPDTMSQYMFFAKRKQFKDIVRNAKIAYFVTAE